MVMSTTVYASVSRKYVMACSHAVRTAGSARSNHGLYIPTILCRGDLGAGEGLGKSADEGCEGSGKAMVRKPMSTSSMLAPIGPTTPHVAAALGVGSREARPCVVLRP